jgi:hypothetical protein
MMVALILSFLIYLVIQYVVLYIVMEFGQNYLYDEVTAGAPIKVGIGAFILAVVLTWTRTNFATMFTSDIAWTVLLAIVWVGVFILIFQFQPWHGFGLAMATMLIFAALSTLVVDSMTAAKPAGRIDTSQTPQKIRRPSGGPSMGEPSETPAKK